MAVHSIVVEVSGGPTGWQSSQPCLEPSASISKKKRENQTQIRAIMLQKTPQTLRSCHSSSASPTHLSSSFHHPLRASGTPSPCDLSPLPSLFLSTLSSSLHSLSSLVVISFSPFLPFHPLYFLGGIDVLNNSERALIYKSTCSTQTVSLISLAAHYG